MEMKDLEITHWCAVGMGIKITLTPSKESYWLANRTAHYQPLRNDAQAMALIKKFGLHIRTQADITEAYWRVDNGFEEATGNDLNRTICCCVAKIQIAKDERHDAARPRSKDDPA